MPSAEKRVLDGHVGIRGRVAGWGSLGARGVLLLEEVKSGGV